MFKLARRRYLQEIFGASNSCTGEGRRCTCDPDREESAGKPTNSEAQLPNGKAMTRKDCPSGVANAIRARGEK